MPDRCQSHFGFILVAFWFHFDVVGWLIGPQKNEFWWLIGLQKHVLGWLIDPLGDVLGWLIFPRKTWWGSLLLPWDTRWGGLLGPECKGSANSQVVKCLAPTVPPRLDLGVFCYHFVLILGLLLAF